jgi:hypothetical protein
MTQLIINGNAAEWRAHHRIGVTLGTTPRHGFEYVVSADGTRAILESYLPVDAEGDPIADAKRHEKAAWQSAQEFLRRARESAKEGKQMADKPYTVNPTTALKVDKWYGGSYVDQKWEIIVLRTADNDYSFQWDAAEFKKFAEWAALRASQLK